VRLLERGHRQPVAELARRYGVKKKAQMRDMVREARERGLLPKLKKSGRPGGVLTPRALAMLGQQTSTPPRRKRR
jgi:transposase-like protein